MNYPFTSEEFVGLFATYNTAVWPIQILFYFLAAICVYFVFNENKYSSKIISSILGFFWLWMGIVYHLVFFTSINPAAKLFGIAFIIQGLLFIFYGIFKKNLVFQYKSTVTSYIGMVIVAVSLLVYPVVGFFMGHMYPNNPTFGLPCPTTMFTLGMLLFALGPKIRTALIPFLWSILGFMAALSFGIKEDLLLLLSGLLVMSFLIIQRKNPKPITSYLQQ